jgi:hypothetical protein
MRIEVVADDGTRVDVTEAVRTMYDLLNASMDWGSGFLSLEDVIETTRLAELCGFVNLEGAAEQVASYLRMQGPCPVCPSDSPARFGVWRLAQPIEEGRAVQHHPCGHAFALLLLRHEPAALVPRPGLSVDPCTHPDRTRAGVCRVCGDAVEEQP